MKNRSWQGGAKIDDFVDHRSRDFCGFSWSPGPQKFMEKSIFSGPEAFWTSPGPKMVFRDEFLTIFDACFGLEIHFFNRFFGPRTRGFLSIVMPPRRLKIHIFVS